MDFKNMLTKFSVLSESAVKEDAGHSVLDIISKGELDRLCKMHIDGKDFTDDKALCDKFCKYYDLEPGKDKAKVKSKVMKDYGAEIKKHCKELSSEEINESEERPYICTHFKKGKHECYASSAYKAAKKAAEHWGLKSTAGIDTHLADITHSTQHIGESFSLKSIFEQLSSELINENQISIEPAQQNMQVIKKNNDVVGTVNNPALAAQLKRGIESGDVSFDQEMNETEQLDELAPLAALGPALMTGARVAGPWLAKRGAQMMSAIGKGAGSYAKKNPIKTAVGTGVVGTEQGRELAGNVKDGAVAAVDGVNATFGAANDMIDSGKHMFDQGAEKIEKLGDGAGGMIRDAIGDAAFDTVKRTASTYGLPLLAAVALLYGGKKVLDKVMNEDLNDIDEIDGTLNGKEVDWDSITVRSHGGATDMDDFHTTLYLDSANYADGTPIEGRDLEKLESMIDLGAYAMDAYEDYYAQYLEEKWAGDAEVKSTGQYADKTIAELKSMLSKLKKSGPHKKGSKEFEKQNEIEFAIRAKKGWKGGVSEGERPHHDSDFGAGLGAGRSRTTLEGKQKTTKRDNKAEKAGKKVTKDIEYDEKVKDKIHGKKRHAEDEKAEKAGKKVAKDIEYDEKRSKKAVREGMEECIQAARLEGKAHGLKGHSHMGDSFESREEASAYHQGYKDGLDERFGMRDVEPAATMPGMASQELRFSDEERLDELSLDLIDRASNKSIGNAGRAMGAWRKNLQSKGEYDKLEADPEGPEARFHSARSEKFRKAWLAAKDRDHDKEFAAGQAKRMSPAAMRKMKQMQDAGQETNEERLDELSPELLTRASKKSMDNLRAAGGKMGDDFKPGYDNPEQRFHRERMKKFDKAAGAASERDRQQDIDSTLSDRMSPAAMRKMSRMEIDDRLYDIAEFFDMAITDGFMSKSQIINMASAGGLSKAKLSKALDMYRDAMEKAYPGNLSYKRGVGILKKAGLGELEVAEGMMDKIRGLNYKRLAQRSMNKAAGAMDKAADFDFSDLDNREEHEDEFMRQMNKRSQRAKKASELLGYDIDADDEFYEDEVFESWDRELKSLLKEDDSETVNEGLSVSVSKGQENVPDSVSVTAQGDEAGDLLNLVKHMSGSLFGGEQEVSDYGAPKADQPIDDHDQMMALMKAVSYDDEGCDSGCDMYEEESEDQMEFKVAEDNQPDSGAKDSIADEEAEAQEDQALAGAMSGKETEINEEDHDAVLEFLSSLDEDEMVMADKDDVLDEEQMDETNAFIAARRDAIKKGHDSFEIDGKKYPVKGADDKEAEGINEWANDAGRNGTDEAFQQDIDFMTKVISGGLNKQKKDQTTLPHTKVKVDGESPEDWMKLAGIKK